MKSDKEEMDLNEITKDPLKMLYLKPIGEINEDIIMEHEADVSIYKRDRISVKDRTIQRGRYYFFPWF